MADRSHVQEVRWSQGGESNIIVNVRDVYGKEVSVWVSRRTALKLAYRIIRRFHEQERPA
jgi:hypothetical protein